MTAPLLQTLTPDELTRRATPPVDTDTLVATQRIVDDVRVRGEVAVREYAAQFGELETGAPLIREPRDMQAALDDLDREDRMALERACARIEQFAIAQREAIRPMTTTVPGGQAGHTVEPVAAAGCYAPGGRYPLPSSVLMTAVTARVAGCERVIVASPGAHPVTLAAAALANADAVLAVGGAHAIAALAYGLDDFQRCDVIAGPGNRWVTAAKQLVSGIVGIDMLAGPSELLVIADETADPALVAADLLAQAEHDTDAVPMLLTTSPTLIPDTLVELEAQLEELSTRDVARQALKNGFACCERDLDRCLALADHIAAEHLEIMTADPDEIGARIRNAGALFVGSRSAEVLGDYGAGPNHTLPTGGTARFQAGLSVSHFLRLRTWLRIDDPAASAELLEDTQRIAHLEHLAGHATSARRRVLTEATPR